MKDIISVTLDYLGVRYTSSFLHGMSVSNLQGGNMFGIVRLLGVFGVVSHPVRIEEDDDLPLVDAPFLCQENGEFVLVTSVDDGMVSYRDAGGSHSKNTGEFYKDADKVAVILSLREGAGEPRYEEHRREAVRAALPWCLPVLWILWAVACNWFLPVSGGTVVRESLCIALLCLASAGLFLCVLLHRQWMGRGSAVEKVCGLFKSSNCSAAHDTFFFNKWFDLSEAGAAYFSAILVCLLLMPERSGAIAWMVLPSLPATLWNLWYQFFKQKTWCPLCVSVQLLLWIIAAVCLCLGAYSPATFNIFDFIYLCLMWGTALTVMTKLVTPLVRSRAEADSAKMSLARFKGSDRIFEMLAGERGKAPYRLTVAVSPTCPYCRKALEKIEDLLIPSGRFTLEKVHTVIHNGDKELIEKEIGVEEAGRQIEWCKEHDVKGTPTFFIDGRVVDSMLNVEDFIYL